MMNLKLLRAKRGRPGVELGERAAYLLDDEKRNLALIAKLRPSPCNAGRLLGWVMGIEPTTSGATVRCSAS